MIPAVWCIQGLKLFCRLLKVKHQLSITKLNYYYFFSHNKSWYIIWFCAAHASNFSKFREQIILFMDINSPTVPTWVIVTLQSMDEGSTAQVLSYNKLVRVRAVIQFLHVQNVVQIINNRKCCGSCSVTTCVIYSWQWASLSYY